MTDPRITEIAARQASCVTYNFGMWGANKLAHEDVPYLLERLATAEKQIADALALADAEEHGALRWEHPLPVPYWVGKIRAALAVQDKEAR